MKSATCSAANTWGIMIINLYVKTILVPEGSLHRQLHNRIHFIQHKPIGINENAFRYLFELHCLPTIQQNHFADF